ncbi:T9SS type B sorting domain-containing protein [Flavobacterium sp. N1736]|uniref:T9SS type B sorting domain-containing protein n=1 Tax=Flavobacterium sp. N1736 TaxID=2986823 RepID=UPI0022257E31|nr:T9SS type B sorting domain-containing protein [Flavobacterium sp. N1736]
MKLLNVKLFLFLFLLFPLKNIFSQNVTIPLVKIKDHKENTAVINIDCDYDFLPNNGIQLIAQYPEIRETNSYNVSSVDYAPVGDFDRGEKVFNISESDDVYSKIINLPFAFCFYGNLYSQIIISDNGIVNFNTLLTEQKSDRAPSGSIPNGLTRNSIFGVFHDMQGVDKILYRQEGNFPNRKFIINYNNLPQYGYGVAGKSSTSQIVLYETTNIIDVYVKDRFKNEGSNSVIDGNSFQKNAAIGLTNYDSSAGIAAPGRDSGNWEAHNEAWRFTPNGNTNIAIQWFNDGSEITGTRNLENILVYPTQNAKYEVTVTYNLCTPVWVTDTIEVQFSQDFPTAKEITTAAFCVNNGESYTLDLTLYEPEINPDSSLSFSYFEDQNLTIPISDSKNAYSFSNNKTIYVKVLKSGVCYSTTKLNLKLNKKPIITPNQFFEKCDENNDGKETINLNTLGITGLNGITYKYFESQEAANNGNPEITNYTAYPLDVNGESDNTKTLYLRVWNTSYNDPDCYTIVPFKIKLKQYIKVKTPDKAFLICNVTEGQLIKNYNLTQHEAQLLDSPITGINLEYYTNSSYAASYKILNPASATLTMNTTIYVKATAVGYCDAYTQISLAADDDCDGSPGGGGGGGGGTATGPGGPGGGGGAICDTNETSFTVNLDVDYLKFYLQGGLTLSDITLIGFYDSANNSLLTDMAPYTYIFSPPFFKVVQARYKINNSGIESYVNFPVSASKKATINPSTFEICDIYNDGKEIITIKSNYDPKPKWQMALEAEYPGATIHFFAALEDLNNYEADPSNITKIITDINLIRSQTTIYVYVKYYGCIYTHELNFNLVPIIEKSINPAYVVCDFDDDKKEIVDIIKISNNETDIKNELSATQLSKLQTPIRYYRTLVQAHSGATNYISNLTNFEINPLQMSVFARLNINEECPVIVEVKFQFTTAVALPVLKNLLICDVNNDNQEFVNLNEGLVSSDPNAEITLYATLSAAEAGNEGSPFFISNILAVNYLVTVSPTTIYVRVYDKITTCWKIVSFNVNLIKTPVLTNTIIKSCDFENDGKELLTASYIKDQLIANNPSLSAGMVYKFYKTQAESIANTTSLIAAIEGTSANSVWVNVAQNIGDCPIIVELKFDLVKSPELETKPLVYTICNNNTGNENAAIKENVILDKYRDDILGFPITANHTFTYYDTSENDAIAGGSFGKVSSAYTITSFPKTIWVRVIYTPTGCFSIKPIIFEQTPSLENVIIDSEIIACGNGEMSKEVDLRNYPPQMITASSNLNDFAISYHNSRANAVNNVILNLDITRFIATSKSEIWIKFASKATGCYIIKKLSVIIYDTPKAQDIYEAVCDETDGKLDGEYVIPDLHVFKTRIINGESNLENLYIYTYYKNQLDAVAGNGNTVNNLNYTFTEADVLSGNFSDSHTIYARIDKKDNTGCFSVVGIQFQINKKVSVNSIQPELFKCDESDNDGKINFDLSSVKLNISTDTNVGFKYYPTKNDAQNSTNEIINFTNWRNLNIYEHIVYVRVNAAGYCDNIASIKLKIYPYIKANDYISASICEFESDGKTESILNLLDEVKHMTSQINSIPEYSNLLDDLEIVFYTNLSDAQNPTLINSIPKSNLSNYNIHVGITEIWVRFQSKTTNCFEIKKLTLKKLKAPEIKIELTPFRCSIDNELLDAVVKLNPIKENELYSYSFDNGTTFSNTKNSIAVNSEQTINYIIKDENGCKVTGSVFVPGYNPPRDLEISATPIYCNTIGAVATVTVNNIIGATTGSLYTYEIINPIGIAQPNSTGIFSGLSPGTYQIKATDNVSKCSVTKSIEVLKAPQINIDVQSHIDIMCNGKNTGSISFIVSNFISSTNYTYELIPNISGLTSSQTGNLISFADLSKGKYTFSVTDNISGCTDQVNFLINEPPPLIFTGNAIDITCNGANDGKIKITATGGTGLIKYAISPNLSQFEDKFEFDNLSPGTYQILAQDELGCSGSEQLILEIKEPDVLQAKVINPVLQEICEGDKNGEFSISIFGGTLPYSVSLDNSDGPYKEIPDSQYDFTELVGGKKYKVFIKDAVGCITEIEVNMENAVIFKPQTEITYYCIKNETINSVTISIQADNIDLDDIDYALDNTTTYQRDNVFKNIAPGVHTIRARHTNGCEQTTLPFTVKDIQPLRLTLNNGALNEIVATVTGGQAPYKYSFSEKSFSTINKLIFYQSQIYIVTVTDKNGCTTTVSKYFEYIDLCIPNHFTPNGDGINDEWEPGCSVNFKNLTYTIVDRYGRIIANYKLGQKWDGKYNGNELPSGDYWYILKLNDSKDDREFTGHFTLYR